jgi:hypothetical protein
MIKYNSLLRLKTVRICVHEVQTLHLTPFKVCFIALLIWIIPVINDKNYENDWHSLTKLQHSKMFLWVSNESFGALEDILAI